MVQNVPEYQRHARQRPLLMCQPLAWISKCAEGEIAPERAFVSDLDDPEGSEE